MRIAVLVFVGIVVAYVAFHIHRMQSRYHRRAEELKALQNSIENARTEHQNRETKATRGSQGEDEPEIVN